MTIQEVRQRRLLEQALQWVDTLSRVLGCAGEPACEADTGGEACTACEARAFLTKAQQPTPRKLEPPPPPPNSVIRKP